jgi:hypothetical protein
LLKNSLKAPKKEVERRGRGGRRRRIEKGDEGRGRERKGEEGRGRERRERKGEEGRGKGERSTMNTSLVCSPNHQCPVFPILVSTTKFWSPNSVFCFSINFIICSRIFWEV